MKKWLQGLLGKEAPAPVVTFIYTYYNQEEMLRLQLENWSRYPAELRSQIRFMLVDDGSRVPAKDLVGNPAVELSIYRVMVDLYCNIGGARNLGTQVAETEWILHSDMDHILPPEAAAGVVELAKQNQRKIYKFQRIDPENGKTKIHPGTMLLTKSLYWEVGGCDEDFVGNYGQTDIHFFYRANQIVETEARTDIQMVIHHIGETAEIDRSVEKREPNARLFEEKKRTGNWSKDFVRFPWEKQR